MGGRIKQSICFGCFHRGGYTPEQVIKEAAKIGYASVEMLGEQYWGMVRDAGMKVAIIGGHGTLTNGLNKRSNHDRIEDELLRNIEKASANEIPSLTAGNPGRRDMDEEQEIYYPAVMRAIANSGYDMYVGHEFVSKGDPIQAMHAAFKLCDV
ncbi:hypothetical protein FJZ33_02030 [Candidatus Poribacteria bacterium]|nr:hypothetical protein [Candidatus Poribacteria bacterium]